MEKILFVNFTNIYGGGEVFLKNITNSNCKSLEKILLTPKSEKIEKNLENVEVIYGTYRKQKFISINNIISIYKEVRLINKIIKAKKIDYIFLNGSDSYYLAPFINKKVKKIGVWHGINMETSIHKKMLTKYSFNCLDKIIVVSEYQKNIINNIFVKKYNSKIHVVHIGRDKSIFNNEKIQRNDNNINLLMVARLEKLKGHIDLIDAMSIVCKKYKNINLIIAGEGEEKDNILMRIKEHNISNYINLVGFVDPIEYYKKSDIFILPSHSEAFPLVNLEAMAFSLPIISTDVGGVSEAIENGKQGYLVKPHNIQMLAGKIINLIESKETRDKMGKNAREKFLNQFTIEKMCNEIYRIITN